MRSRLLLRRRWSRLLILLLRLLLLLLRTLQRVQCVLMLPVLRLRLHLWDGLCR